METQADRREKLAALLRETAEAHHLAFKATDGADPDWPIWYAGRLLEQGLGNLLDAAPTKSDLIYLLVTVAREQEARAPGAHWDRYYADFFLKRYTL